MKEKRTENRTMVKDTPQDKENQKGERERKREIDLKTCRGASEKILIWSSARPLLSLSKQPQPYLLAGTVPNKGTCGQALCLKPLGMTQPDNRDLWAFHSPWCPLLDRMGSTCLQKVNFRTQLLEAGNCLPASKEAAGSVRRKGKSVGLKNHQTDPPSLLRVPPDRNPGGCTTGCWVCRFCSPALPTRSRNRHNCLEVTDTLPLPASLLGIFCL